jgi:WD40 repeat protein
MDVIRISDAALTSSRRRPEDEGVGERGVEEDSIDLIDKELRRILESKGSDSGKEPSHTSKFSSNMSKEKYRDIEQPEDRFASVMEQMEFAINAESLKPGKEFMLDAKNANSATDNRTNSKWLTKKEPTILEKRRTLVKGRPPSGSVDKENLLPTAQKPASPKAWRVADGKRLVMSSNSQQLIPLSGQELKNSEHVRVEEEPKQDELSFSMRRESKSKEASSIREPDQSQVNIRPKENEFPIKKPRLFSEESYIIDGSLGGINKANKLPIGKQPAKLEVKQVEQKKEPKVQIQPTLLSPIARITDNTDTKGSVHNLFSDQESSPIRQMNSGQKEELAKCTTNLKLAELKSKLSYLLKNMKTKDCMVFTKLVMNVLKDFNTEKHLILTNKEYIELATDLENTTNKIKELSKILQTLSLTNDTKLASAIIDNLSEDIVVIISKISKNLDLSQHSTLRSKRQDSEQDNKSEKNKKLVIEEVNKKSDDLNICLKKSTEKLSCSRENLSARLDFDEMATDNQKLAIESLPPKREVNFNKKYQQENLDAGHRRAYSRGPREEKKEAEAVLSQKFGCKVYSIKLMNRKLVCGFEDGTLSIFIVNRSEGLCLEKSGKLHSKPISSISCTMPEQRRALIFTGYSGGSSCSIVVWDAATLKPLKELCGHSSTVSSLQYILPNYLITTSFDRKVIFWDLGECEAVLSSEVHQTPIISSYYHSETKCLYTGSLDGTIVVSGLVMDHGELTDLRIFKKIAGQGPILSLACCLDDKIMSLQNSRLTIYDSRGLLVKEVKTNTMPTSVTMLDEEKGFFVDAEGKPHPIDLTKDS